MTESVLSWQKAGLRDCLGTYRIRRMLKRNSKQQGTGSVRLSTVAEPLDLESLHRSKCILSTCYAIPDCRVVMTPGTWYLWSKKFALVQRIRQPFVCSTKNILYHSVAGRLRVSRSTNGFSVGYASEGMKCRSYYPCIRDSAFSFGKNCTC